MFTPTNSIARLWLVVLLAVMTGGIVQAQSCACKQAINVSLDESGQAVITAEMLLADGNPGNCPGIKTVSVMKTPTGQPIAGSPVVNCSHIGQTLYGKVSNGNNSCWTAITIKDDMPPWLTCTQEPIQTTCTGMHTHVPSFGDNCPGAVLDTIGEDIIINNNCTSPNLDTNILKRVIRKYQVIDAKGNKSPICTVTFDVLRVPSLNNIVFPPSLMVRDSKQLECDGDWPKLANGNPAPTPASTPPNPSATNNTYGTGVPYISDINLYPDPNLYCNLAVSFTDVRLPQIGCVTKIMRTWSVIEWACTSRTKTHVQVIEIRDTQGPEISAIPEITASTTNNECEGNVTFPAASVKDNCSPTNAITTDITFYPNGNLSTPGLFIKHGQSKTVTLPVGSHLAVYTSYDACYNSSSHTVRVVVEDNTPPVAICDEFATIGLTTDGTAWVPATVFDDGSYDECNLAKVLVRRMTNANCLPCETPSFPGFDLIGERGTGAAKRYYYLSKHMAYPHIAFKTARAMGGYAVSYDNASERNEVKAFVELVSPGLTFVTGYNDVKQESKFVWESGATTFAPTLSGNDAQRDYVTDFSPVSGNLEAVDEALQYRYVVEIFDPCGWSSYAQFCCADINPNNTMVALRAIDKSGNFNDCMVSAVIQDKIGPVISCPADRTVSCDFVYDPANLAKDFGTATATDNCENPVITSTQTINITSCRTGTIKRTFTVTDRGGRTASCEQTITFASNPTQVYEGPSDSEWPIDIMVNGCGDPTSASMSPDATGRPILSDGTCSLVAAQYVDQVFSFNNPSSPACFKILRRWTVIDWCKFSPNTYVDEEGDVRTYPKEEVPGLNIWHHTQEIKVIDKDAPVFDPLTPTVSANTTDVNCADGYIRLVARARDFCTATLRGSYKFDLGNDGTFGSPITINSNTIDASGTYPVGMHKIVYTFEDKCGNVTTKEQIFTIVNTKAPTPYVKKGLATTLMKIDEGEGSVDVWATDFDNGSAHVCGYPILMSFTQVTLNNQKQMVGTPNLVFDCDDTGEQDVRIWVAALTPEGTLVQDFVDTYVDIQDNNNVCDEGRAVVSGAVATEANLTLENVYIELKGSEMNAMTDENGSFNFGEMAVGGTYTVMPEKNDDPLNGVSTLDLVWIQRHILGLDKLQTPYSLIAADATKDGRIAASDLVELRKLILGTTTQFSNNKSWRFVDKSYTFQDPQNAQGEAFPEVFHIDLLNADMTTDFTAIKVGDVNQSARVSEAGASTDIRSAERLVLTTPNKQFESGKEVVVPVTLEMAASLSGFQFTVAFDNELLTLTGVNPGTVNLNDNNLGFANLAEGLLTVSWNEARPMNMSGNAILFTLVFAARDNGSIEEAIQLNSTVTQAEAYDEHASILPVSWKVSQRSGQDAYALYQNTPNPFRETTVIGFDLPATMDVQFTLHDVTGKSIRSVTINGVKGYNSLEINKNDLNPGVMYYSLKAGDFSATRKMVVIE